MRPSLVLVSRSPAPNAPTDRGTNALQGNVAPLLRLPRQYDAMSKEGAIRWQSNSSLRIGPKR